MNNETSQIKRQTSYVLKGTAEVLVGRPEGRQLAEGVLRQLEKLSPDSILPINFSRLRCIDFSCADEFLTKVLRRIMSGELGTRYILLEGMSEETEENVATALEVRNLVCPRIGENGKVGLLGGKIGAELIDTYNLARKRGRITARDVMEIAPRVGISAISNRIAKLLKLGLLIRTKETGGEGGGRQFYYEAVG